MNLFLQTQYYLSRGNKMSLALLIAAFLTGTANAETHNTGLTSSIKKNLENVTGTVKDAKGEPLPGVSVLIKGTKTATVTDVEGRFRINLPTGNETLVFTYLGFETREIAMSGRTTIDVTLNESTAMLDQVVVTGYGTKKRSEIVGAIATVTGEELMDIPAPNLAGAMRNRIAGVGVSQVSGRPGAPITLNIRNASRSDIAGQLGATTEPLYVVDGITITREEFDNIDASMIENMSILKDASASIYGAAGAKGVVLITTKRGKSGKPSISYNGYAGISDAASTPEMLSGYEHALLLNDTYRLRNEETSKFFSPQDLEYIRGLNNKSWFDQLWKPAATQRHNLSVSGGTEKLTFFAGGSYQNENANWEGMKFDKYSFRSGATATITEGLKADIGFNVDQNVRTAKHNLTNEDQVFFERIISVPSWVPMSIDGQLVNYNGSNPRGLLESGYFNDRKSRGYRINASLSYEPQFLKGLTAKLQVSQGSNSTNSRSYDAPYNLYNFERMGNNNELFSNTPLLSSDPDNAGVQVPFSRIRRANDAQLSPTLSEFNSYQAFFTLQYAKTLGLHSFNVLVGGEQSEANDETLGAVWANQLIPGGEEFWAFDANRLTRGQVSRGESTKRSFFGRFSYDIDKKYLIEGVARLDASSNFALGNRWGLSPSLGLGWVVSRENFFKDNVDFVNFLKLKVNYGIAGDDRVAARLWQDRYIIDTNNGYLYGNNNGNSLIPSVFPNPEITWEKKRTFNAGLEATMFNNKLDLGVEVFQNYTYDGLDRGANNLYPLYLGIDAPVVNYREVYNWGSEFTIGYKAKIAREVSLNASINFGYGNSVVERTIYAPGDFLETNLADGLATSFGTDPRKYNQSNIGLIYQGTFRTQAEVDAFMEKNPNYRLYNQIPQPGFQYFEDTNEDGIINDWDMVPMYNNTNAVFNSGINLGLGYKSFNLSTNIFARIGGKVFYDGRARIAPSTTRNILSIWEDRWSPENPDGRFPRFDQPSLTRNSTFWAVDGTTVRINNLTLSYKVPAKYAGKLGLGGARVLATGNNLWTIVNPLPYKDPYTSSAYDYPILRTISLGLSVNL
ncbi:SusC/RagA family TonB-linked outer membrane protein [Paradesertivirga mongoliensis]|uniref:SusC/RagA family TonB-linked outer membrane protein n=1 Tax=Paradesertivirga mongoliensis TaxID=2100740 RepID=A0ABW4ZNY3_9SPHI|nr:TonB-dependent receptor [Pedobacter mongoliensis]